MKSRILCLIMMLMSLYAVSAQLFPTNPPANVTLAWDASPSTNVVKYRVYYGVATRYYTNIVEVNGTQLTATVSNLVRGTTYYFAATAVDNIGLESDFSNEVSYRAPNKPSPPGQMRLSMVNGAVILNFVGGEAYGNYSVEKTDSLGPTTEFAMGKKRNLLTALHLKKPRMVYATFATRSWHSIAVVLADGNGTFTFTDADIDPTVKAAFYRTKQI